jgi:hypothetical protein
MLAYREGALGSHAGREGAAADMTVGSEHMTIDARGSALERSGGGFFTAAIL